MIYFYLKSLANELIVISRKTEYLRSSNGKAAIFVNTCVRFPLLIWVLQSSQCSKIRVAEHWGRRGAHLSENKGMKSESKTSEENSRETASVTSIVVMFQ